MSGTPAHLKQLESALAGLAPSLAGLNRDRLMYEAGRQAAPRRLAWPIMATAFAGLSAALGLSILLQPEPAPRLVSVILRVPVEASPTEFKLQQPDEKHDEAQWGNAFSTSAGYLSQRDRMLFFGTDALSVPPAAPATSPEPMQDLKALRKSI